MDPIIHRISGWDRLPLCVREWYGGNSLPPVLCLPGLVRIGADFEALALEVAEGRRVVAIDYPGRGDSGRSRDINRDAPAACLRAGMDACAALHVHGAVMIGSSFGGLPAMGLAAARPILARGVILNDIGPEIGTEGGDFVRDFVGRDPALDSLEACVALLRANLPPMSLHTDSAWRRITELTYQQGGGWALPPGMGCSHCPGVGGGAALSLGLVRCDRSCSRAVGAGRGEQHPLPETVARMLQTHPDMQLVTLPGIGHAPILTELPALAAIRAFLAAHS